MRIYLAKILIPIVIIGIILLFAAAGVKFLKSAKNIYELENTSGTEIIQQFGQMVLGNDTPLLSDKDGGINILVLGIAGSGHGGENLTDTIIVLTISPDKKKLTISSIPRDLYVELPENNYWSKINSTYAYYRNKEDPKQGIKALSEEVKKVSGFSVNYYIMLDFDGFKKLIDAVGGIDYTLAEDLYDPAFPDSGTGYEPLFLKAGTYHLDGDLALKLSRSRHTTKGDFSRIERQHQILKLLQQKLEDKKIWNNLFAVNEILNILSENVKTNIAIPEIQKLNEIAKNINSANIKSKIPNGSAETGLLYDAKAGDADVLLPRDPSYGELIKFYQE